MLVNMNRLSNTSRRLVKLCAYIQYIQLQTRYTDKNLQILRKDVHLVEEVTKLSMLNLP